MIDFKTKRGFICDMDGVLYHGNKLLPGATEFIQWLQASNKEYLFLTNNSGFTPRELHIKLLRMGIDVSEEHFIPVHWRQLSLSGHRIQRHQHMYRHWHCTGTSGSRV